MTSSRARAHQVIKDRGLVLRRVPYRDSDLILTCYTETLGKCSALARSGRKSQKRFGGSLQAFVFAEFDLAVKENADLAELRQAQPLHHFERLSQDPMQLGRASYLTELVDVLQKERDPNSEILQLLIDALGWLNDSPADDGQSRSAILRSFEVSLLRLLGLWPDHARCQSCGSPLNASNCRQDLQSLKGLYCAECRASKVPENLFELLQIDDAKDIVEDQRWNRDLSMAVGQRTQHMIRPLLTRPLRSLAYLRSMQRK